MKAIISRIQSFDMVACTLLCVVSTTEALLATSTVSATAPSLLSGATATFTLVVRVDAGHGAGVVEQVERYQDVGSFAHDGGPFPSLGPISRRHLPASVNRIVPARVCPRQQGSRYSSFSRSSVRRLPRWSRS
jgi:hypothetical protein